MNCLLQRQPPALTSSGGASTSGRSAPACVRCPQPLLRVSYSVTGGPGRRLLPPCRITSTAKELYQSEEAKKMNMDDNGEDAYMDLPNYQVFDPDLGPLEKRVQRSYMEAVRDDKVDLRDTEYWFSTPNDGWNNKPQRLYYMPEAGEPSSPQPWHSPEEPNGGDERIAYTELEEGRMYLGVITDVWLYHGVQVDIGAEVDGLIPCTEELWELAVDHIDVGIPVMVEIHKLRTPGLYRWPVQLKFTIKGMQDLMVPPDDYSCPIDFGWAEEAGWTPEQIARITGRTIEAPTYFLPYDEQILAERVQDGYGTGDMPWREEPSEPIEDYVDDPLDDPAEAAWLGDRAAEAEAAAASLPF